MSCIDIRNFEADTMYKSIVMLEHRHINLVFISKTKRSKFFVYRQDFKIMSEGYNLTELQTIDIVKQKTGFGHKKFFKCPYCGKRRQNLYFIKDELEFACRSCVDDNVYRYRCNLYDGNVKNIIKYKTIKILKRLNADYTRIGMYNLLGNIPAKPKYMRNEKYALFVKKLHFLYWIWEQCLVIKYGSWVGIHSSLEPFSVRDINDMLEENNVNFVYEHFLFPKYYRKAYEILKEKGIE